MSINNEQERWKFLKSVRSGINEIGVRVREFFATTEDPLK
jgi:hypothetical protein